MNVLKILLQCGAFIIIPIATFGFGVWKIRQLNKEYQRTSIAALIGFTFFETAIIGILIDPRSGNLSIKDLLFTSGIIGIITFLFVLLFLPAAMTIFRLFRK